VRTELVLAGLLLLLFPEALAFRTGLIRGPGNRSAGERRRRTSLLRVARLAGGGLRAARIATL
jgi:hypothetical protein